MRFYEVRDVDGTSFTGVSQLVGYYRYIETAEKVALSVKEHDSWHTGVIIEHQMSEQLEATND